MGILARFADKANFVYLAGAITFAAIGYLWIVLFPVATFLLAIKIPLAMWYAEKSTDWLAIAALGVMTGICAWITFDLVCTRIRTPGGHPLSRERYPELWAKVDQLTTEYRAQPMDQIRLNNRFDLEIERTPTTGLPAIHTHTLLIGLPLLQAVSADHLSVLLARKISMMPRLTNWPTAWLYHLRSTWYRYSKDFRGLTPGKLLMTLWFSWYAPAYIRYTLSLARNCELAADNKALRLHDMWSVEEAVTTAALHKAFVENKLWPALLRMSQKYPNPPLLPFGNMEKLIEKELDRDRAHRLLDGLLQAKAQDDMHTPTLRQRWKSLSHNRPRVPAAMRGSAAQRYMKSTLKPLQEMYDKLWLRTHLPQWKERNVRARQDQQRLAQLLEQVPKDLLSNDDVWECTLLVRQYMGQAKSIELYKALLATEPQDPRVYFNIGSFLLSCRDAQGVDALETAMSMDERFTTGACELISEFMSFTGERRKAKTFQRRAVQYSHEAVA